MSRTTKAKENPHFSMDALLSLNEFAEQWHTLSQEGAHGNLDRFSAGNCRRDADDEEDDPFDCSSLAVPPPTALVNEVVQSAILKWKEVDQRKLSIGFAASLHQHDSPAQDGDSDDSDVLDCPAPRRKRFRSGAETNQQEDSSKPPPSQDGYPAWYTRHVRLPNNFDFMNAGQEPLSDDEQEPFTEDRVVSLVHPSKTTPYRKELWKLFRTVPTANIIEEHAINGIGLENTVKLHRQMTAMYHQKKLGWFADLVSPRLRYSDRHDLPPILSTQQKDQSTVVSANGSNITEQQELQRRYNGRIPTIRFECWKRQLKRGFSPDPARMVVEYSANESLLHFHQLIVELLRDELWDRTSQSADQNAAAASPVVDSGFFFFEGAFYTAGDVDYVSPIQSWLQQGSNKSRSNRLSFLGLSHLSCDDVSSMPIRSMQETCVGDLRLRLGTRYCHVCHGDVEISVFATDRRMAVPEVAPFPILHDVWKQVYSTPNCEACQVQAAVLVTKPTCPNTDGVSRFLCGSCSRLLQVPPEQGEQFRIWRCEDDLSCSAGKETSF
jgi:snRNA-activating protein complex (SNAPc), subunit 3